MTRPTGHGPHPLSCFVSFKPFGKLRVEILFTRLKPVACSDARLQAGLWPLLAQAAGRLWKVSARQSRGTSDRGQWLGLG